VNEDATITDPAIAADTHQRNNLNRNRDARYRCIRLGLIDLVGFGFLAERKSEFHQKPRLQNPAKEKNANVAPQIGLDTSTGTS
jgi:hypothetical protein